ncbi:hypothetical protein MED01_003789 [Micromonospora sp. MED01]|uniref:hypothetical protein n=1 Tax=Micromonospora alfalfae TaxID=2911212 RepID=UPI001EE797C3|nr:hypothetical protein [Micromonospora alfalfae]MCG5465505.1 hypothetical protein [Micromonospora alfalfae]
MAGQAGGPGTPTGVPRWVKVIGLVVAALLVVFVVIQVSGVAGEHGPGRHLPGGR